MTKKPLIFSPQLVCFSRWMSQRQPTASRFKWSLWECTSKHHEEFRLIWK